MIAAAVADHRVVKGIAYSLLPNKASIVLIMVVPFLSLYHFIFFSVKLLVHLLQVSFKNTDFSGGGTVH